VFRFLRSLQFFSRVVVLVYIPTTSVRVLFFPCILTNNRYYFYNYNV
jgi:hypothetical protein